MEVFSKKNVGPKTHRCFPVNFAKFLRTPFLTEHLRRPLLFCILILKKCISRTYMPYMYVYNCISRNYGNCGYFVKASWKNRKNFLKILRISEWRSYFEIIFFSFVLYLNDYYGGGIFDERTSLMRLLIPLY